MGDEITRWWSPPGTRVGVKALRFDFSVSRLTESEPARVAGAAPKAAGRESAGVRVARSLRMDSEDLRATTQPVKGTV